MYTSPELPSIHMVSEFSIYLVAQCSILDLCLEMDSSQPKIYGEIYLCILKLTFIQQTTILFSAEFSGITASARWKGMCLLLVLLPLVLLLIVLLPDVLLPMVLSPLVILPLVLLLQSLLKIVQ